MTGNFRAGYRERAFALRGVGWSPGVYVGISHGALSQGWAAHVQIETL